MEPNSGSTDALVRETYAQFGVALFRAQTLEVEIVKAMVIARLHEKDNISRQEIDAFMNRQLTLGQLLKELKKYVQVNDELKQTLREALEKAQLVGAQLFQGARYGTYVLGRLQSDDQRTEGS